MITRNLLRISVTIAVAGMGWGIAMGVAQDFQLAPAHAHLNLVGYVSLFLAGIYYQVFPAAARTGLARIHAWVAVVGGLAFPLALAVVLRYGEEFTPLVIVGSFIAFIGMILFATVVFRNIETAAA